MADLQHELIVHGGGKRTTYTFVVEDGEFGKTGDVESNDTLANANRRISGEIGSGDDTIEFSGVLVKGYFGGNPEGVEVEINGKTYSDRETVIGDWQKDAGVYADYAGKTGGGSGGPGGSGGGDLGGSSGAGDGHRDTGGSNGANQSSGSDDGGVGYIIQPGDLQSALNDLHEDGGDGPGNERRSYAKLQPNATFDPGETVHIPRNMIVDASGASIVPSDSYDLFTFDLGGQIRDPYVNLRGVPDGESYDARVFIFDPQHITYDPEGETGRNEGYVDKDAWKPRDGDPHNKYRFLEHTRQNQFANGAGVKGGATLGNWRDESTLFYFHNDQNTDGWHNSSLALFTCDHSAKAVSYPIDFHSEGSKGYINNVTIRGHFSGPKVGITMRGDRTLRKNAVYADFQPQDGVTEHVWLLDNPTAEMNLVKGCMWDSHKSIGEIMRVKRSESGGWRTANNKMLDMSGHSADDDNYFRDTSGGEGNDVVAMPRVVR